MKKFAIVFLCFCFILNFSASFVSADTEISPDNAPVSCYGLDANGAILGTGVLEKNVRAAFLFESNSQTLMYAMDADKPMYPASLVKIMTGLLALELGKIEEQVIVSDSALSSVPYDAVSAKLQVGEQMKLEDLLYCMIVGSANDAAAVIAEHICGNQDEFVKEMNAYANKLGCTGTNFVNVHGLHDEQQVTTARDVARILDRAYQNEAFRTIFTTKDHIIAATNLSEQRKLTTGNSLVDTTSKLYYDSRVTGGRTGVTEDGRRCLAVVAENNGMRLISVVMGSESVYQEDGYSAIRVGGYQETTALLDAGFNGYQAAQIMYANQAVQQCKVENGDCDLVIGPLTPVSSVLPADATVQSLNYRYSVGDLQAPISKGEKITRAQIWSGNMCVGETDLFALNSVRSVEQSELTDNPKNNKNNNYSAIVWTVLGIVAGAFVLVVCTRYLPRLIAKRHSAQYRRSRRRSR